MVNNGGEVNENEPTPRKRLKLSPRDCITAKGRRDASIRSAIADNSCTFSPVLLNTPMVRRKKTSLSFNSGDEKFTVGTPQSILKVSIQKSFFHMQSDSLARKLNHSTDIYTVSWSRCHRYSPLRSGMCWFCFDRRKLCQLIHK